MLAASNCYAGASEGLVTTPLANEEGIFIFTAGAHATKPACSTAGDSWAVNMATAGGRSMQSTVLVAYAQGKRLHVQGKNACDVWADRESPSYIFIVD